MRRFFSKTRYPSYHKDSERKGEKQKGEVLSRGAITLSFGLSRCHFERGREIYLLDLRHEFLHRLSDTMHRRRLAILRKIPHIDDGDEFVSICIGEDGFQQSRIEGTYPERGEPLILRSKHQVCGDDGGIDLGAVLAVVAADPGISGAAPDGKKKRGAVVGPRRCFDGLQRVRSGDGPYVDRLLVDSRGGDSAGGEDAIDEVLFNGLRREGTAGVAAVEDDLEVHGNSF